MSIVNCFYYVVSCMFFSISMIEFENKELIYSSSVVLMSVEGFKNCINN